MNLVKILSKLDQDKLDEFRVLRPILFHDNQYIMSVQASKYHYCTPRKTLDFGEYTHYEVMLKIPRDDISKRWEKWHDMDNVYTYVPKEEIEELLKVLNVKYGISQY